MAGGGTDIRPWKTMKLTAPQSYTTLGDLKTWLDGVIPTSENIWILKDTMLYSGNYEFIGTMYINNVNTYHIRRMNNGTLSTAGTGTAGSTEYLTQGETLTVFYQ